VHGGTAYAVVYTHRNADFARPARYLKAHIGADILYVFLWCKKALTEV